MADARPVVLRGGLIVDGTGAPASQGDLLIEAGLITGVGRVSAPPDALVMSVAGLVVAPGFIDMHSHSDLALLTDRILEVKLRQGITTEVIGQDGISYAPASPDGLEASRELFAPVNGDGQGLDWSWRSVAEFLARFQAIGQNVVYLLPQGTIRFSVVGTEARPATDRELDGMRRLVDRGMREGAFGLSTGLTYPGGAWSSTEELIELSRVVGANGGIYVTHHRDYGAGLAEAIEESLRIGSAAQLPVHFSHFHVSGSGREGQAELFLAPIQAARSTGQRVTLDVYPYEAGCTILTAFLPDWLRSRPAREIVAVLRDRKGRQQVVEDLQRNGPGKTAAVGWEDFVIGGIQANDGGDYRGRRLGELAREQGLRPEELVCDLLVKVGSQVCVLIFQGHEANIQRVLADPHATVGTDGILGCDIPHPRASGTYPRLLRYVREGRLNLEDTITMMSGRAASVLGLVDRGTLKVGQAADVVVFDQYRVTDTASYKDPTAPPVGIEHVLVNGQIVLMHGNITGALPGRVLSSQRASTS